MRHRKPQKLRTMSKPKDIKSKNIEIDLFFGDEIMKFQNDFMHAGDVFEKGKHLAAYKRVSITGTPDLNKLCENIKNSCEKSGGYVLFVAIREFNKGCCKYPYYLQKGIQTISDGAKWGIFKDILISLGYTPEYDEHLIITKIL